MQSLSRGWSFLQEAWQMAFKDNDLIKPSIYSMIVGLIITIIGIVPLIAAAFLFGVRWTYRAGCSIHHWRGPGLCSLRDQLYFRWHDCLSDLWLFAEGDGRMDKAWAIVQREFWHIVSLAAASTVVNVFTSSLRRRSNRSRNVAAGIIGSAVGGILETVWTEASYLILPAMMIEDANLVTGIKRATYIAKNNLLLIGVSTVGVKWITGLISFVLGAIGFVIGVGLGLGIISITSSSTVGIVLGIGIGAILFFLFVMVASVISSYTMTAYNTCLFLWARDVEKAQAQGQSMQVAAPAPLAAVLA